MSDLDSLPRALIFVSPETATVTRSNTAAQEWFRRSASRLRGTALSKIMPELDADLLAQVHSGSAPLELREAVHESGGNPPAHITLYPQGDDVGLMLTPRRARSNRRPRTESIQSLGQMIGHELKNPLAGIQGAAQLLKADVTDSESLSLLDLITSEIDRIRRLADRLQTFGEGTASTSAVNVHTLLRQARRVTASASEVLFTEDYDPSLPHVEGDADLLMQALVNLLKNAVEAGGDQITLRTRSRPGVRRGERALPIEVQIIDTGPGVAPHLADRIFQPFVSSKSSGQGLGLAFVSKVVDDHGGLVELDSVPGATRFSLLLPAAKEGSSQPVATEAPDGL